jgi:hypothetical protein
MSHIQISDDYQDGFYPAYVMDIVDSWGGEFQVVVSGYGGVLDDNRLYDIFQAQIDSNRVNWPGCQRLDRAAEASAPLLAPPS